MNFYLGTYEHSLLPNYQLAIPKKIRSVIKGSTVILSSGFDKCIFGFDTESFSKISQPGLAKEIFTDEGRTIRRDLFGTAEELKMDVQGRLSLPANLRTLAGIEIGAELYIVGAGDHFEIWSKENWERQAAKPEKV